MADHVTWRDVWSSTTDTLGDRSLARWLCETASGCDAQEFDSELDGLVSTRCALHLESMVRRVLAGEPAQYVMGRWAFRHLDLMVDARVLIPRPETELLVEHVLRFVSTRPAPHLIADLGTGSGAIGLSLLHELPIDSAEVWLTDVSTDALHVARANAAGIGRPAARARFAEGSWCDALPVDLRGRFTVLASNPPYISPDDAEVQESVRAHEPHVALFSGDDGLRDISAIAEQAPQWLEPGGMLIVEMGHLQADAVRDIFAGHGLHNIETHVDLAGKPRFTTGTSSV
jgi:release factor glutamine methyltransferase